MESHLIEKRFKLSNSSDHENLISLKAKLVAQELSFLMLYHEVNSSIFELHQIDSDYDNDNERFANHQYDEKEKILKELKEKWALKREGIGESYEININIPEEIQKIMKIQQIICN